jgi:uncharacterized protein YndB with AHSA1/START domain
MTGNARAGTRILGTLRSGDDTGIVRMEDRYDTNIDDLWSAITDPRRLARWLGEIEGDLEVGGEFRAHFFASGWEGTGHIQVCEPPRRLLVLTKDADGCNEGPVEVTLIADGDQTILVWEERVPVDLLPEYGAGIQVHVEDLVAHIAGRSRSDATARWEELIPAYRDLPVDGGQ